MSRQKGRKIYLIQSGKLWFACWIVLFMLNEIEGQYLFSSLQYKDGLASKEVASIVEDADGFLWFGTSNGLNRYDGSTVKVYNHAHHNYPSALNENISEIVEYDQGTLVLGTQDGLVCFDVYQNQFTPVDFHEVGIDASKRLYIHQLVQDPLARIWIATNQGCFVLKEGRVIRASNLFPALAPLDSDSLMFSVAELDEKRHGIWFGTNHGLHFVNYVNGSLFSPAHFPDSLPVFHASPVFALEVDPPSGDLYWSDWLALLNHFVAEDHKVRKITYPEFQSRHFVGRFLFKDRQDRIWLSTWQGITFVIEPDSTLITLPDQSMEPYPIKDAFILDLMETKNGTLWLGTTGGAYKLSVNSVVTKIIKVHEDQTSINSFIRLPDKKWVIAKETGLFIYDEKYTRSKHFQLQAGAKAENRIFQVKEMDGMWWCGTGRGIQIFNPQQETFSSLSGFPLADEINAKSVLTFIKDSRDHIWLASWNTYVYRYDPKRNECIRFDGLDPEQGDIGLTNCLTITEDDAGRIWVGHSDKGLRVYDYAQNKFYNPIRDSLLNSSVVNSIRQDDKGAIWITTTGNGMFVVDRDGEVIRRFTTEDGLTSNLTNSVTHDPYHVVWFATPEAIHYLKPGATRVGTIDLGIESSLSDHWIKMDFDEKHIYASVYNQIFWIDRNRLRNTAALSAPLISGIRVFEDEIPFSPLHPELNFSYRQNFFRIDYSSALHRENPSIEYEYQLKGFDPDWVSAGRHLSAGYTNVPPGDYVFHVRAVDGNGNWTSTATTIPIFVSPPFWKSPWFYLGCASLLGYILYRLYRFQQQKSERKKGDQIIDYFANAVYGENAVNEICWDIARNCISQLGFKDCVVYLLDEDRKILIEKAAFGPKNPKGQEIANPLRIPVGKGIVGHVAQSGMPILVPDTSEDDRYIADDEIRYSELAVPIMHDHHVIGVIDAEDPAKHFFTADHQKTLSMIASISALKIADAKAEIEKQESDLRWMEVNKLFAESQLKALRAQMNPHFVFNCLNSIQECIVTRKYAEASSYLNKFAKLFRLVLNNSGKMLISITEEADILKLYLELESMRFDHSIQYKIFIDPELDADDILMPSMFLQPFVENALWHGLMHKAADRQLSISFHKLSDDVFSCVIEDNGVGRLKSGELKRTKGLSHKYESKGMAITEERLEVLRKQLYHARMYITDAVEKSGQDTGTRVTVELSMDINNL